jgi:hypothetical protein
MVVAGRFVDDDKLSAQHLFHDRARLPTAIGPNQAKRARPKREPLSTFSLRGRVSNPNKVAK